MHVPDAVTLPGIVEEADSVELAYWGGSEVLKTGEDGLELVESGPVGDGDEDRDGT